MSRAAEVMEKVATGAGSVVSQSATALRFTLARFVTAVPVFGHLRRIFECAAAYTEIK